MRCPFQMKTIETRRLFRKEIETKFTECLFSDCPYYDWEKTDWKRCGRVERSIFKISHDFMESVGKDNDD